MERTNNFSCRFQLLVKPGGPLKSTVNEDFRETVCLRSSTGKRELDRVQEEKTMHVQLGGR
jgi:hypothetical protein